MIPGIMPAVVGAASFPSVEGVVTKTAKASSITVDFPAGTKVGDLIFVAIATRDRGMATPAGWTVAFTGAGGGYLTQHIGFWKILASGDSTTTAAFSTTAGTANIVAVTFRISGGRQVEAARANGGSSSINPPALAPSWGLKKTLWLALGAMNTGTRRTYTAPAGYQGMVQDAVPSSGGSDVPSAGGCWRQLEAASEDPGIFGGGASSQNWAGATVGIAGI